MSDSESLRPARTGGGRLWPLLFLIVFVNGFEAGGYQASLWNIGQTYALSTASKGLFASVELLATMLAPLLLGAWADRTRKRRCLLILLGIQLAAALLILISGAETLFLGGVFALGLTTSALQFISIAALADAYPLSGPKKIGYMTSMYALGAFVAPLAVSFYLGHGLGWRTLFALLAIGSAVALAGLFRAADGPREASGEAETDGERQGAFVLWAVLLLCVVMCIYVGFENGFAFFVDTLFAEELHNAAGKYALSLFWVVMIPSRMLVGRFARHAPKILPAAVALIPCVTVLITLLQSGTAVLLLCIPLGLACGAIYPCALTMLLPFAGSRTATATGMITTATGIGGVAFTALTGLIGERWGIRSAMCVLAACFALSLLAVLLLRRGMRRR